MDGYSSILFPPWPWFAQIFLCFDRSSQMKGLCSFVRILTSTPPFTSTLFRVWPYCLFAFTKFKVLSPGSTCICIGRTSPFVDFHELQTSKIRYSSQRLVAIKGKWRLFPWWIFNLSLFHFCHQGKTTPLPQCLNIPQNFFCNKKKDFLVQKHQFEPSLV